MNYEYKKIGEVAVDSGQIFITDPCYLSEWKHGHFDLHKFDRDEKQDNSYGKVSAMTCSKERAGMAEAGVATSTENGDGMYEVFHVKDGQQIVGIFIDFAGLFFEGPREDDDEEIDEEELEDYDEEEDDELYG